MRSHGCVGRRLVPFPCIVDRPHTGHIEDMLDYDAQWYGGRPLSDDMPFMICTGPPWKLCKYTHLSRPLGISLLFVLITV
jgi:hypothetical protein